MHLNIINLNLHERLARDHSDSASNEAASRWIMLSRFATALRDCLVTLHRSYCDRVKFTPKQVERIQNRRFSVCRPTLFIFTAVRNAKPHAALRTHAWTTHSRDDHPQTTRPLTVWPMSDQWYKATIQALALQPAVWGISCLVLLPYPCNDSACTKSDQSHIKCKLTNQLDQGGPRPAGLPYWWISRQIQEIWRNVKVFRYKYFGLVIWRILAMKLLL